MGVPKLQMAWGNTTTHPGTHSRNSKQPDQCFSPGPRQPTGGQLSWPTLVIETGVTESLPKLEEDVQWWFQNSNGDVQIVLVLSINKSQRTALLQKWQLAPVNTPQPMTRAVLNRLRRQVPPPMPPLLQQMPRSQQPYIRQEIQMTQTTMTGGPLVLPFEALFCRPPQGTETDITLNQQELLPILRNLWSQAEKAILIQPYYSSVPVFGDYSPFRASFYPPLSSVSWPVSHWPLNQLLHSDLPCF